MKKSWGLLEKILTGHKTIESRWYKAKYAPWNRIKAGETVYFKNSGESIVLKVQVRKVIQFSQLTPKKVLDILNTYGKSDGLHVNEIPKFFEMFKNKKYCILIFLKNPRKVKPFKINKAGFGAMTAWISVDSISKIRMKSAS